MSELRYALRSLRKSPGFAVTAVLMLAFGIGATTVFFGQFNAIFLKPLPVADPDRLRVLEVSDPARPGPSGRRITFDDYMHLRDRASSFSDLPCWFTRTPRP